MEEQKDQGSESRNGGKPSLNFYWIYAVIVVVLLGMLMLNSGQDGRQIQWAEFKERIEDGEVKGAVRNPGYRGISRTFWRNLVGVADADSFTVMGTPNCGKGELNQMVGTGHASPACLFADVDVFGGES